MKFRIQDIVETSDLQLANNFECSICLGILHDPVQTICNHHFCAECLPKRHGVCPVCKMTNEPSEIKPMKEANVAMYRLMGKIRVVCPYRHRGNRGEVVDVTSDALPGAEPPAKKYRPEEICGWSGCYVDLLETHLGKCPGAPVVCQYCDEEFQRRDLQSHEASCWYRFTPCRICGENMTNENEHMTNAARAHVAILEARLDQANFNLHPRIGESFRYAIKGFATMKENLPKGHGWKSPMNDNMIFQLEFFPNGTSNARQDQCSVFLQAVGTCPLITYIVKVKCGKLSYKSLEVTAGHNRGVQDFGPTQDVEDEVADDQVIFEIVIKSITRIEKLDALESFDRSKVVR